MELKLYEEYKQSTYTITSFVEDQVLTGRGEGITSRALLPQIPVLQGYLLIALSRDPMYTSFTKWKISLNNIILTREFKPHIDKPISEKLAQTLFIYDVTKTLSRDVTLKIGYEGRKPIRVDTALLITIHRYNEFHLGFNFITKIVNLSSSIDLPETSLSFEPTESYLDMGVVAEKSCSLELEVVGNNVRNVKHAIVQGFNMVEIPIERGLSIRLINSRCSGPARHIFTCLFSLYSNYPRIDVEGVNLTEEGLSITLHNTGSTSADDVEVILLRHGVQVYRSRLGGLKAGEVRSVSIPRSSIRGNNTTARILWYKALKVFSRDITLSSLNLKS